MISGTGGSGECEEALSSLLSIFEGGAEFTVYPWYIFGNFNGT